MTSLVILVIYRIHSFLYLKNILSKAIKPNSKDLPKNGIINLFCNHLNVCQKFITGGVFSPKEYNTTKKRERMRKES